MWQIIGQDKLVSLFQRSLEQNALSHAYLLVGPARVGKMTLAINLAQALNCRDVRRPCGVCLSCEKIVDGKHADVQKVGLSANSDDDDARIRAEISIEQIRWILHSSNLPPFEGEYRVYIIDQAEKMSLEAANCLLKTLEEPAERVVFILLTVNEKLLPVTVVSRCQRLELARVATGEVKNTLIQRYNTEPQRAELLARLSRGCFGWAMEAASNISIMQLRSEMLEKHINMLRSDYTGRFESAVQLATQFSRKRESVYEVLDAWLIWWRDLLLAKTDCRGAIVNIDYMSVLDGLARSYSLVQIISAIKDIRESGKQLKLNANPRLVFETLMLNLPRMSNIITTQKVEVQYA
jgi:DNA polymerase III subunit delta'